MCLDLKLPGQLLVYLLRSWKETADIVRLGYYITRIKQKTGIWHKLKQENVSKTELSDRVQNRPTYHWSYTVYCYGLWALGLWALERKEGVKILETINIGYLTNKALKSNSYKDLIKQLYGKVVQTQAHYCKVVLKL